VERASQRLLRRLRMRFEVEVAQEETGLFRATAVLYPDVTATGRTEKEALGLLMEAMERYMKKRALERA
jgi:predicted RNase H-like HicB family nuclease